MKRLVIFTLIPTLALPTMAIAGSKEKNQFSARQKAQNVIFMVPDGMGLAYLTAARSFLGSPDGPNLAFENLPQIGYQRTHSENSFVTDSAAAASAWACGEKFSNGEICYHGKDGTYPVTLLEAARDMGKATALVATSRITHATPAAYAAHVPSRGCENLIATHFIENEVDVILGGGQRHFDGSRADDSCGGSSDNLPAAMMAGYDYVTTKDEMDAAVAAGSEKLLGLFMASSMSPHLDREPHEPALAEMTAAALDIFEEDKDGFFIVIEGSQIDWAGHANDHGYMISEMIGFNEAFEVVEEWLHSDRKRIKKTLVIVVPDHETGGLAINGPYGSMSGEGVMVEDAWTSGGHTAVDTIIWSQGPGSKAMGAALDNTDLYGIIMDAMSPGMDDDEEDDD